MMTQRFADVVDRNNAFYRDKLRAHGPSPRGVDFNSPEAMTLRFAMLLRIRDDDAPFTVNDYGCAYGALHDWMTARGWPFRYRGFDVSEEMIAHARRLHAGAANAEFVTDEADLTPADFTVASGLFNMPFGLPADAWLAHIHATLGRLAALSRRGFAFNALTVYSDPDRMRPDLYYADPTQLFDFCKRTISRRVALLHDYPLYDFTILVRTDPDRAAPGTAP